MKEIRSSTHYVGGLTSQYNDLDEWDRYHHNPKYCRHNLGYYSRDGKLTCVTCGASK